MFLPGLIIYFTFIFVLYKFKQYVGVTAHQTHSCMSTSFTPHAKKNTISLMCEQDSNNTHECVISFLTTNKSHWQLSQG